mgnify:CR=1 FL=1
MAWDERNRCACFGDLNRCICRSRRRVGRCPAVLAQAEVGSTGRVEVALGEHAPAICRPGVDDPRPAGAGTLLDCATGGDATPRSRKARALLAYLAISPDHCASRERLIEYEPNRAVLTMISLAVESG